METLHLLGCGCLPGGFNDVQRINCIKELQ
jgi:hypothetical protein